MEELQTDKVCLDPRKEYNKPARVVSGACRHNSKSIIRYLLKYIMLSDNEILDIEVIEVMREDNML